MEKVTLIKGSQKMEFTERAAKIAVESFGWQEFVPLARPAEIGTRTRPPEIKPVPLIKPPEIPAPEPIKAMEPEVKKIEVKAPEKVKHTRVKK